MKNKIGIMTFHRSLNYGSAIQAWALSKTIQKLSEKESEIIDYIPNHYEDIYAFFIPPTSRRSIKNDLLHVLLFPFFLRRKWDFLRFWKTKLPLSDFTIKSNDDFTVYAQDYSTIICGSDQIWNVHAVDFDMAFFLPGITETRKISYAASLGGTKLEEAPNQESIKKCLEDFDFISTREESAAEKIEEFIENKKEVEVVLDPTLLVSKDEYEEITLKREVNEPYIFFYSVRMEREAIDDAINTGKRLNMPVYTIISGGGTYSIIREKGKLRLGRNDAGPGGFLSLLRNAELVITNSFHGTALSILFEKNFVSINTRKHDGKLRNDERISSILNLLNLNNRFIESDDIEAFDFQERIDYSKVSGALNKEIQKSIDYIKQALSD